MPRRNLEQLRTDVGEAVRTFQRAVDALDQAVADHLLINRTDLRCIGVLLELGEASPGQLSTALKMTTGSVTAMLDRLEKLNYLTRSPDPGDRRKLMIRPTSEVAEMVARVYEPLTEAAGLGLTHYSRDHLEVLMKFLVEGRRIQEEQLERIRGLKPVSASVKKAD